MKTMLALLLTAAALTGQDNKKYPGQFEWVKDLDTAMAQSAKDGRPVIAYFTFET